MDVERELQRVEARVKRSTDHAFYRAMAKIDGITVEQYLMQQRAKEFAILVTPAQALGAAYRGIHDAFVNMIEQFAKGWNGK